MTTAPGVQVIAPNGKYLGLIPTPRPVISVAFSGRIRKRSTSWRRAPKMPREKRTTTLPRSIPFR